MPMFCNCKCSCALASVIAGVLLGVIAAFLQITGVITVTAAFLWVVFGIGVVYLAVLAATAAVSCGCERRGCACTALNTLLTGVLGSILLSVILLAVGIVATSVVSAILVAALIFFFTLTIGGTACYVRALADCAS